MSRSAPAHRPLPPRCKSRPSKTKRGCANGPRRGTTMRSGRFLAGRSSYLGAILLSATLGASLAGHGADSDRAAAGDGRERRAAGKAVLALLEDGFVASAERVGPAVVTVAARRHGRPR